MTAKTRQASLAPVSVLLLSAMWCASPASAAAPCRTSPAAGGASYESSPGYVIAYGVG